MTQPKPNRVKFVTPAGRMGFSALTSPSKFNKYETRLVLADTAYEALMETLQAPYDEAVEAGQAEFDKMPKAKREKIGSLTINPIATKVYDDNDEWTGEWEMKFSYDASGTRKDGIAWEASPPVLFDAKGQRLSPAQARKVWRGSTVKVAAEYIKGGYFIPGTGACGLKTRLKSLQVIEISGPDGGSASSFGFGVEEGFEVSSIPTAPDEDDTLPAAGSDF